MHNRLRTFKTTAALAAGVVLLAACGGGGSTDEGSDTDSADPGTGGEAGGDLLIWVGEGPGGDAMKDIAKAFGEENGVDVTVEALPGEEMQGNFVTASQANKAPDVVLGAHDWIGNLVQNGAIDPIQLPEAARADLQPLAVEAVTFDEQVYGMPHTMNNIVLFRNTDLVPEAPQTIEELISVGEELKASGEVKEVLGYPVGSTGNPYFINPLYTSGGGYMFGTDANGDFNPDDLGVAKPEAVAAYEKIAALGEGGQGVLKRSISGDNALGLFTSKKTAFLVEGPWQLPNLTEVDFEYDVSPVPGFEGGEPASPFITVDAAYVASKGENKTLGQEFVTNYWPRADVQQQYFEAAQGVPASQAVLSQIQADSPLIVKVAEAGAANGQIMPSIPEMAAVWDPLGKAEAAVIAGEDPAATIRAAATAIQRAIE
jgi:arabinogalactan oligomer/maltooligosaccharide transport system substrate-binding protein